MPTTFIKNAQHAQKIGDKNQYLFVRGALKKTAAVKKMLERQLLSIKNALLIQQQAQASQQFAESMNLMAIEIGRTFSEMELTKTQAQWERAVAQAGSIEERMDLFLDSMEQGAISGSAPTSSKEELVTGRRDRPNDPGGRAGRGRNRSSENLTNWRARSPRNWARSKRIRRPMIGTFKPRYLNVFCLTCFADSSVGPRGK